jgi:linoleoyl-CoA desaturase
MKNDSTQIDGGAGRAPDAEGYAGRAEAVPRPKFDHGNAFQIELRRRADEFFLRTGRRMRDCPSMYVKTALILAAFSLTYAMLVFLTDTWVLALPMAVLLGLITAGIGFNIMHDGGHEAYSRYPAVNRLMAMSLDLIGGSSYLWHWKHGVFHHTFPNLDGYDADVALGRLGRLTPHQPRRAHMRWQHWYIWPLYGALAIKWHFYDDFRDLIVGRIGKLPIPRPKGRDLAILAGGKLAFFGLALGVPLLIHPLGTVLAFYAVTALVLGMSMSLVFQLAHAVEEAEFPLPAAGTLRIDRPWAVHQVETTVDFMRHSRLAAWLLGGLNFQIEHHLFPRVCHVNYPALARVVEQTCRDFGVRYHQHKTLWAGLVSHARWLRRMGRAEEAG